MATKTHVAALALLLTLGTAFGHENHWQTDQTTSNNSLGHNNRPAGTVQRANSEYLIQPVGTQQPLSSSRWETPPAQYATEQQQGWYRTAPSQSLPPTVPTYPTATVAHTNANAAPSGATQQPSSNLAPTRQSATLGRRSGTLPPIQASQAPSGSTSQSNQLSFPQTEQQANKFSTKAQLATTQAQTINLDLFVGEVRVLGQVDTTRVAVGNGSIVDAKVIDTNELLIIATAMGSTSLRLWNSDLTQTDYNIRVSEHDPQTRVRLEPMVRMRVRMVEFRKSALGKLGIDWSDGMSGPTLAAAGATASNSSFSPAIEGASALASAGTPFSTYFGITSNIASRINFLAQNGDAVTLAEPVLSAMNGGEASFLAGGEVPYPSVGQNGQTQVEFKDYGVKLKVAPLIDNAGNVRAKLQTEISQLDSSVSIQGAPGLLTRRAQTEVTVRSGETIVISGLLSSESSGDVDMIPGIGKLPIIGRLFSSRSKRNSVSELVIFVTPEVIEPQQPMISGREQRYYQESNKRLADIQNRLLLME